MSLLAHLIDPKILVTMSPHEIEMLGGLLDAEIVKSPELLKELQAKVDPFVRKLGKRK